MISFKASIENEVFVYLEKVEFLEDMAVLNFFSHNFGIYQIEKAILPNWQKLTIAINTFIAIISSIWIFKTSNGFNGANIIIIFSNIFLKLFRCLKPNVQKKTEEQKVQWNDMNDESVITENSKIVLDGQI